METDDRGIDYCISSCYIIETGTAEKKQTDQEK